ncbi:MAG: di-heme oxidoredictase family protein [Deltaproteobacteria bacterium]|jgi:CxxC motif-containing protein (DUF1111 family)
MKKTVGVLMLTAAFACTGDDDGDDTYVPPPIPSNIFAPMGEIVPFATAEQREIFERGKEVAERRITPEMGLGPDFNVTFCASCHEKPVTGGSAPRYRNFLLVGQELSDGSFTATGKNGVQTQFELEGPSRVPTAEGTNVIATRNGIPFFGVGLLAELTNEAILVNADPDDADGDGISGRPNYDRGFVGRFGRKSQTVSIEGFIRGPLFNHLGVTTVPLSEERKAALPVPSAADSNVRALTAEYGTTGHGQAAAPDEPTVDEDGVIDPEMSEQDLFDLIAFAMLLAAPAPDALDDAGERGERAFMDMGCDGCHVPTLVSPRGSIPVYSDLLLHDMGPELADGIRMKEATGSEFRTQPLWGLAPTGPFLHDGRADTIDDAIRMHGGEATAARDAYLAATEGTRGEVVTFLEALGGKSKKTDGLLPPNAPVPAPGEYGGPAAALTGADAEQFVRGRKIFDDDTKLGAGLGPTFNGDSCRACHFDPVIGGSGPLGLNVMRHGYVDNGVFTPPANGTMAHKIASDPEQRPPAEEQASVFEMRQTPPLFGLGMIDRISEVNIIGNEDPMDVDGDGIRGIAHVLPDGRIGRLGWKANVPSLAEFSRDATSNEIGLTVPEDATSPFGFLTDEDDVADPEITQPELDDLTFFMENLAPPPRVNATDAAVVRGEMLFDSVGCTGCHIPTLQDEDGNDVPLYSDLLLHDVAPPNAVGIADGMASIRHFRTSPLWGLRDTAPYLHDGSATTIEQAIAAHEAEADAVRMNVEMLSAQERADLLAFLESL